MIKSTPATSNYEDDQYHSQSFKNTNIPHRRRFHILLVTIGITATVCLLSVLNIKNDVAMSRSLASNNKLMTQHDFELMIKSDFLIAKTQSFGLFDTIRSEDWERMKQRVQTRRNHFRENNPTMNMHIPRQWYMFNFDPDFTCPHERRISNNGGTGDGGKWVCDAYRISAKAKKRKDQGRNGCLIYSVGSEGDFMFENAIQEAIGDERCEIHVFDVVNYGNVAPKHVHFHPWGLKSSKDTRNQPNLKSLQETIKILGHEENVIDIFKIDCEGCEWTTYTDWMEANVRLDQILVEVHNSPPGALNFFETMQNEGYVTFHKEANLIGSNGSVIAVEYGFLKLSKDFFK